ncbi:MAG: Xaa-Pro peptidase family protein [Thermodesulfobacteriota bacterium]|jgi:Xaa-Pro aminopeptidase
MENTIIQKQREEMRKGGYDALVSISPENTTYTAGVAIPSQSTIRQRHVICLVPVTGDPKMIVVNMEESFARANVRIKDIRAYNEFTESPMKFLADAVKESGLENGRIGIELDYLPARDYVKLKGLLSRVTFEDAESFFGKLRMIKTQEEIDKLRRVGKAAEKVHHDAFGKLKPGMTELDLAGFIVNGLYAEGVEQILKLVVGAGERCSHANPAPTKNVIKQGDMIRVDIFATLSSYLSDVARTAVVGKPTAFQKETWKKLIEARAVTLENICPGAHSQEIYQKFSNKFREMGLDPINFVGHGLGLTLHEDPYINKFSDTVLEPGMVLCVEPYYMMVKQNMGFQIEDEIIVTEKGYELITNYKDSGELIQV